MEKVLIANQREVVQLLPMAECIDVIAAALRALAEGQAILPLRTMMALPDGASLFGLMPAYLGSLQALGAKAISIFPGNHGSPYDSHQGVVLLFDAEYGVLRAIVDGVAVTAIRTAAVSGLATRLLALQEAGDLALIGAGVQAHTHLEAMNAVRRLRRVRVYSLPVDGAQAFAERETQRLAALGRADLRVEAMPTAEAAVDGADLICTVTTASEPVLQGAWVSPGAHINAVGAFRANTRELDTAVVARSRLFVDRREAALREAGDFLIPKAEGAIGDEHIVAELGELLTGAARGRQSPQEVTLFKSLGLAIEDLAAAQHVLQKARQTGLGAWLELGGRRFGEE